MKKKQKKEGGLTRVYKLSPNEVQSFYRYLMGYISSRELGALINTTHQGALNATAAITKEWIQTGRMKFTNTFMEELPYTNKLPAHE